MEKCRSGFLDAVRGHYACDVDWSLFFVGDDVQESLLGRNLLLGMGNVCVRHAKKSGSLPEWLGSSYDADSSRKLPDPELKV